MKTILIGYDGTETSKHALKRAAEIAKPLGSKIVVTSVAPMLVGTPRGAGPYDPADPPSAHDAQLHEAAALLEEHGIYTNPFISPGVPPKSAMLRTSYMATHERHHLDKALEAFAKVGKKYGVI